jgi:hypothetical protein
MPTSTLRWGSRFHHQVDPPLVSPPSRDLAGGRGAHSWSLIVSFTSPIKSFTVLTVPIGSYVERSSPSVSPTDIDGSAPDEDTVPALADSMHASQYKYTFAEDDDESQDNNGEEGNDDDEDKYDDETGDEDDKYNDDEDEYDDETGDKDNEYTNENEDEDNVDAKGFDGLLSTRAADTILDQLATSAPADSTRRLPVMACKPDSSATTETQSDPSSFTQPKLPSVMQSSVASTICSGKADGASPLTIMIPAPWKPAVRTCNLLD